MQLSYCKDNANREKIKIIRHFKYNQKNKTLTSLSVFITNLYAQQQKLTFYPLLTDA